MCGYTVNRNARTLPGKIYDPCCGSAGMFVQSVKFVESHQGKSRDIALYGQELTATTYKLAK